MATVDVLDRELVALELVLALQCIGSGARHGDADEHRRAGRAGRIGADRGTILGEGLGHQASGKHCPAGDSCRGLQQSATGKYRLGLLSDRHVLHCRTSSQRHCWFDCNRRSNRLATHQQLPALTKWSPDALWACTGRFIVSRYIGLSMSPFVVDGMICLMKYRVTIYKVTVLCIAAERLAKGCDSRRAVGNRPGMRK